MNYKIQKNSATELNGCDTYGAQKKEPREGK